jgi:hypothetical protein
MHITFDKPIIRPEFESYSIESTSVSVNVGIKTNHLNVVNNKLRRDWYLKNIDDMIIQTGTVDALIGGYYTVLVFNNLDLNCAYFLEIHNPNYDKGVATIYTGNIANLQIKSEQDTFPNSVSIRGDLIFDRELRKVKLSYAWSLSRVLGNGIIYYQNLYYLFKPSVIFTTNKSASESMLYSPFNGILPIRIPIVILSEIKALGNQTYSINPPNMLEVLIDDVSHKIDEKISLLDVKILAERYSKIEIFVRYLL